jgi:hypothetical protein
MGGRFGRTKRTRRAGRAYGKLVGRGIAVLILLTSTALAFWLLRRRAREETAPATRAPEVSVEEATPPETEVVASGPPTAEDAPQGRNHLRVRNVPRGAGLRLRHRHPPEKNHRRARSDPEDSKGQLLGSPPYSPTPGVRRVCAHPRGSCLYSPRCREGSFSETRIAPVR